MRDFMLNNCNISKTCMGQVLHKNSLDKKAWTLLNSHNIMYEKSKNNFFFAIVTVIEFRALEVCNQAYLYI